MRQHPALSFCVVCLVVGLVAVPRMLLAQSAPAFPVCQRQAAPSPCVQPPGAYEHDGFYLRAVSGFGYSGAFGNGPTGRASVRGLGLTSLVGIGGTPARGLVVAGLSGLTLIEGGFNGSSSDGDVRVTAAQLGVLVDWFPRSDAGWHAAAGVGFGGLTLGSDPWRGRAAFATITGGYDFWIGPEWSLGVGLFATASTSAAMKDSSGNGTGYDLMLLSAGISNAILFH